MNSAQSKEIFEHYIDGLIEELYQTNSFFKIYDYLYSQITNEEDLKVMNKAPAFFAHTMKSLQLAGFMGLSRLFEPSKRSSRNIFKFLDFLEVNHKHIFTNNEKIDGEYINYLSIKKDRQELEESQYIIDNLLTWRDKILAHNDKQYFKKENLLSEQYPIKYENIEKLIMLGAKIMNKYQSAYSGKHTHMEATNVYDVKKVIQALKSF